MLQCVKVAEQPRRPPATRATPSGFSAEHSCLRRSCGRAGVVTSEAAAASPDDWRSCVPVLASILEPLLVLAATQLVVPSCIGCAEPVARDDRLGSVSPQVFLTRSSSLFDCSEYPRQQAELRLVCAADVAELHAHRVAAVDEVDAGLPSHLSRRLVHGLHIVVVRH